MILVAASMALEPAAMQALVKHHQSDIDRCGAGARDGAVDLRWEFDGHMMSRPTAAHVADTRDALGPEVGQCIADASLAWEFPPRGRTFEFTFIFKSSERQCTPDGLWLYFSMGTVVVAIADDDFIEVPPLDVESAKLILLEASALIGTAAPDDVILYKYASVNEKEARTGRRGYAHACDDSIHATMVADRHELMHVVTSRWHPLPLLEEGLAIWFKGSFRGRAPKDYACDLVQAGEWIPAQALLEAHAFLEANRRSPNAYVVAGGVVATAIDLVGVEAFLDAYKEGRSPPVFIGNVECYDIAAVDAILRSNCVLGEELSATR